MKTFKKNMSQRRLDANQANARKSTSPGTPEAKAASPRNAFVPKLPRVDIVMSCEEQAEFDAMHRLLRIEFSPRSHTEEMIFQEILAVQWSQRRFRAIETAFLRLALAEPDLRDGFKSIEGAALAAQAYKHALGETKALALLNRQLARLSREFDRMFGRYLQLHGPLDPPDLIEPEITSESEKNEPIPINEHHSEPFSPRTITDFVRIQPPEAAARGAA